MRNVCTSGPSLHIWSGDLGHSFIFLFQFFITRRHTSCNYSILAHSHHYTFFFWLSFQLLHAWSDLRWEQWLFIQKVPIALELYELLGYAFLTLNFFIFFYFFSSVFVFFLPDFSYFFSNSRFPFKSRVLNFSQILLLNCSQFEKQEIAFGRACSFKKIVFLRTSIKCSPPVFCTFN